MHGHPEDKPKLYSHECCFLPLLGYQWQFCIHTYWLVLPTEQVHLWMVNIVVKCTEMSTFYFDHCSPHPWVWYVGVTMLIYIYIYIYLRSMRSAGKCANTKTKYPFNCMWCMHAGWWWNIIFWQERNLKALWYSPTPMQAHTDFGYTHERTVGLHGDMANLVICVPLWFVV